MSHDEESEPLLMASPRRLPRRQSQGLNDSNSVNVESSANDADRPRMLGNGAVLVETPILSLGGIETVEVAVPSSALAFTAHPEVTAWMRLARVNSMAADEMASHVANEGSDSQLEIDNNANNNNNDNNNNDPADAASPSVGLEEKTLLVTESLDEGPTTRVLKWYHLVMLLYFWTCGGPFGFEPTVQAAGPLTALIGLPAIALFWATPQILMSAELSLAINDNGGQFQWPLRAFGPFLSWMNGYNLLICSFISQGLTTTLVLEYSTYKPPSVAVEVAIKLAIVTMMMLINFLGAKTVSLISMISTPFILGAFVVLAIVAAVRGSFDGFQWSSIIDDHPSPFLQDTQWGLYFSTLVWSFGGFDSIGSAAGEVAGGLRSFACAFLLTIPLVMINYAVPVLVGYGIQRDYKTWESGYFSTIGGMVSSSIGKMMIVAAVLCSAASLNAAYVPCSRVIWASARQRGRLQLFPRLFSYSVRVGSVVVPFTATILSAFMTWMASMFPYNAGVQLYLLFRLVNLAIEFASLVRLRFSEPDLPRPYKIPGGVPATLLLCVPVVAVMVMAGFTIDLQFHVQTFVMQAVFVMLYWLRVLASMCHVRAWRPSSMAREDREAAERKAARGK